MSTTAELPPQAVEAEEAVVASLLLAGYDGPEATANTVTAVTATGLQPDDFYRPSLGRIYAEIVAASAAGEPAEALVIAALRALERWVGLRADGVLVADDLPPADSLGRHSRTLAQPTHTLLGVPRRVTVGLAIAAAVLLSGCDARAPLFDQSPLVNYVVVTVNNDTHSRLTVEQCFDALCHNVDEKDTVRPGDFIQDATNNFYAGYDFFRFKTATAIWGCIALSYRSGQQSAEIQASRAVRCSRISKLPSPPDA